jgi:hypothetical protein
MMNLWHSGRHCKEGLLPSVQSYSASHSLFGQLKLHSVIEDDIFKRQPDHNSILQSGTV